MIISNLPFPSLSPQAAKALKGNIYNRRQPVHLGGNHCAADDAERQGKDRRASSGAGTAPLPPLPECGQAYVLCLETGPDAQSETARLKKKKKKAEHMWRRRRGPCLYLRPRAESACLPRPTPGCQARCLASIRRNLFSFIMLICGRKEFCHLRIACTATVNTLACL